jgi:hypothetical protein
LFLPKTLLTFEKVIICSLFNSKKDKNMKTSIIGSLIGNTIIGAAIIG